MAQGKKTAPAIEEKVFATYMACGNYSDAAVKCKMPLRTVWEIVNRLGGDDLAELRLARRGLLVDAVWERIDELLPAVNLANLGVEGKSSVGLEAARALDSLSRVLAITSPDSQQNQAPAVINVNVSMAPPRERVVIDATTTTTLTKLP